MSYVLCYVFYIRLAILFTVGVYKEVPEIYQIYILIYSTTPLNRTSQDTGSIFRWLGFRMIWYETPNPLFLNEFESKSL